MKLYQINLFILEIVKEIYMKQFNIDRSSYLQIYNNILINTIAKQIGKIEQFNTTIHSKLHIPIIIISICIQEIVYRIFNVRIWMILKIGKKKGENKGKEYNS